ncbi:MAG: peptide ABC transporter substrate-binding protein [Chloroflexi bacterium]|nr:peptide ABC transporter substrate-binding protein [Chloroflexota bacterium]
MRVLRSRFSFFVITVLLLSLVLAAIAGACQGNETTTRTGTVGPVGATTPTVAPNGTLNVYDTGPITLDPAVAAEATSATYVVQIFSGLVRLDENLNIVPDIAEKVARSDDGKTYTFTLRKDVKFHGGQPVKAADFKYSWERALNPATKSHTAGTYLIDIVGAADVLSGRTPDLAGVRAIDDSTLQVTIDGPKTYFLAKMSYPTSFVVQKTNVDGGSDWFQRPVGTGPFKLKEWKKDQLLTLQRNDTYYGDRARVKEVVFKLLAGDPMSMYQQGAIDVVYTGGGYIGMVTDPGNPISKELRVNPELSFSYFGFNASKPPFDDPQVRQAFTLALDKDKVVKLSTLDTVQTAYGILPPGIPGYDGSLTGLRFDPVKAKQLISSSTYGDVSRLPPIVFTTSGYGNAISGLLGGAIEEWRCNLGVEVKVRQLEPDILSYNLRQEKDQLFDMSWIADYPDPQDFLDLLFHSGAENNTGEYANSALDKMLDQAAVEQDQAKRLSMYQQAEKMIVDDAAVLPLFFGRSYILVKPYVKDYIVTSMGMPLLNKVRVEK